MQNKTIVFEDKTYKSIYKSLAFATIASTLLSFIFIFNNFLDDSMKLKTSSLLCSLLSLTNSLLTFKAFSNVNETPTNKNLSKITRALKINQYFSTLTLFITVFYGTITTNHILIFYASLAVSNMAISAEILAMLRELTSAD